MQYLNEKGKTERHMNNEYDVIVIGAGPAGLFSAISINNKNILVLEKNSCAGKKLLLSGAGQCNYTNSSDIEEFLSKYGNKGRFLKPALYNYTNEQLIDFFEEEGLESITRGDKKVFPSSLKSNDVLCVLVNKCKAKGIRIMYNSEVESIVYDNDTKLFFTKLEEKSFVSKVLILATGGRTYPSTGSTGDGYLFSKGLGHEIVDTEPALAPIYVENYEFSDLSGISFQDISVGLWRNNKKISQFKGDLLLTHKNLSGPVIINNSRYIRKGDILKFNFTRYANSDEFKDVFQQKILLFGKCNVKTLLCEFNIPKRFVDKILELANLDDDLICSEMDRKNRNKIIDLITNYPMIVSDLGDYNIAMVTKGGVSTTAINSKTMESKIVDNLYFAGEVMDIDGDTGGYNIQAAFSTAKLLADNINKKML